MTPSDEPPRGTPAQPSGPQEVLASEPGVETPPPQRRERLFGSLPVWLVVLILSIAIVAPAGYIIHIPYYSVGPGPSVDVLSLIDVRGAKTYPSRGKLLLTTASVSVGTLNLWNALYAWADPDVALVPRNQVVYPGNTDKQQDQLNQFEMDESKFAAEVVAFRALNLPVIRLGARIASVVKGRPADGRLRAGDLIVSIDGGRVASKEDATALILRHKAGDVVRVGFERNRTLRAVSLRTVKAGNGSSRPLIGVTLTTAYRLPHNVEIDTQQIVGPSGGMIFALSIYDAFTPGDLTKGHIIAGTGALEIDMRTGLPTGNVADIGAIEEKIHAASAAGADVFIAPADQAAAARKVAPKSMHVIGVHTLVQALRALQLLKAR